MMKKLTNAIDKLATKNTVKSVECSASAKKWGEVQIPECLIPAKQNNDEK